MSSTFRLRMHYLLLMDLMDERLFNSNAIILTRGARRQVFRTGGSKIFPSFPPPLRPNPAEVPGFARISWVVLVEAGGPDPWTPLASAVPDSHVPSGDRIASQTKSESLLKNY
jgi:hypothetical protein